jgi:hypothetical protein
MAKPSTESKKKMVRTYCSDCLDDQEICGKDPLECREEADLYFELYDESDANFCRM